MPAEDVEKVLDCQLAVRRRGEEIRLEDIEELCDVDASWEELGAGGAVIRRLLARVPPGRLPAGFRDRPEAFVHDVIPLLPPDLRPLIRLANGNFATSDLNDLYRRIV